VPVLSKAIMALHQSSGELENCIFAHDTVLFTFYALTTVLKTMLFTLGVEAV